MDKAPTRRDVHREGCSMCWYVLYTTPRAEKRVEERLKREGIECWLPLVKTARRWSDRVKIVEVPLFNSYVFVRCRAVELRGMLGIVGVVRTVYYDGVPAVVRDEEIGEIRKLVEEADTCTIESGDVVEVVCGSLKMVSGKVMRVKKRYLVLYLEQLGATVCVRPDTVKKIKES